MSICLWIVMNLQVQAFISTMDLFIAWSRKNISAQCRMSIFLWEIFPGCIKNQWNLCSFPSIYVVIISWKQVWKESSSNKLNLCLKASNETWDEKKRSLINFFDQWAYKINKVQNRNLKQSRLDVKTLTGCPTCEHTQKQDKKLWKHSARSSISVDFQCWTQPVQTLINFFSLRRQLWVLKFLWIVSFCLIISMRLFMQKSCIISILIK